MDWKYRLSFSMRYGGTCRATSPRVAGSSILITSAPRSASIMVPNGPAPNCEPDKIRTPSSGKPMGIVLSFLSAEAFAGVGCERPPRALCAGPTPHYTASLVIERFFRPGGHSVVSQFALTHVLRSFL